MQQLLYLEVPTRDTPRVRAWLRDSYCPNIASVSKTATSSGCLLHCPETLSVFVWSLQATTYLKVFLWSDTSPQCQRELLADLERQVRQQFPIVYPQLPDIKSPTNIFENLEPYYPLTVKFFRQFPKGEYDLERVYWWEKRWRDSVRYGQTPAHVLFTHDQPYGKTAPQFDLLYLGGALGAIHGAMMAKLGYRVCLVERLGFGRMNREWNISRSELAVLVDFGLFTWAELESTITAEYVDGFNKFFDGNNPPHLKSPVLHTPTVLNVALDTSKLLLLCGAKLREYGAEIYEFHEFMKLDTYTDQVVAEVRSLVTEQTVAITARVAIDAMGSASLISQQLNAGRAFSSVCPTVGAVVEGISPEVWDSRYGDVLFSHGDISRGRQLIWELFPGEGEELTVYLFHYHEVHPENPGSLLDMYEDFFAILPEYRWCDVERLRWKKATFGYIPGYFSLGEKSRTCASDRLLCIGDAAAMQSPLVFTGFGSLVRNLPRLTQLLNFALRHDLSRKADLEEVTAYQSNVAVTWLFSKGMMVPTGRYLPPERINAMLNTFFGLLAEQAPQISDRFIKDRIDWLMFNRLALLAALKNPQMVSWIWQMAGTKNMVQWLASYAVFTGHSLQKWLFGRSLKSFLDKYQEQIAVRFPRLCLSLMSWQYNLNWE